MLLQPMRCEQAFLKCGIYGFAGSGKTWSASLFAIGLAKMLKEKKVAFFETETGSDYVGPQIFQKEGIELVGVKSRAFLDCLNTIEECEKAGIKILIIDSITHVYYELCETYMKTKGRSRLLFQDWNWIKTEWRKLTNAYLASKVHIFLLGRAGYEYEHIEDETGKKEISKSGIKMKTETEMGYEPSLLIRMERDKSLKDEKQTVTRIAHIEKDRFGVIDGKEFPNPTFESILPHVKLLKIGGDHVLPSDTRTSESIIEKHDEREERARRYKKIIGEIEATYDLVIPGTTKKEKQMKVEATEEAFGVRSWDAVMQLPIERLESGYKNLEGLLMGKVAGNSDGKTKIPTDKEREEAANTLHYVETQITPLMDEYLLVAEKVPNINDLIKKIKKTAKGIPDLNFFELQTLKGAMQIELDKNTKMFE